MLKSINPANGDLIAEYNSMPPEEVDQILRKTSTTMLSWQQEPVAKRAGRLREVARILRERSDEFARLITSEMGKPIRESRCNTCPKKL